MYEYNLHHRGYREAAEKRWQVRHSDDTFEARDVPDPVIWIKHDCHADVTMLDIAAATEWNVSNV